MIDRKVLGYFSFIFMIMFCYTLVQEKQFLIVSIIVIIYLGLIFGIDRFKIDFKNKKVELEDEHKE